MRLDLAKLAIRAAAIEGKPNVEGVQLIAMQLSRAEDKVLRLIRNNATKRTLD